MQAVKTIGLDIAKSGFQVHGVDADGQVGGQDNPLVPAHGRMRAFDRDLIRGGHYGQRPCVPHSKAEHMAAPTNAANVKKALANSALSTHGT